MHPLRSSRQKGKIIAITLEGIRAHLPNRHQNMIEDLSVSPRSSFHVLVNRATLHFQDSRGPTMYRLYVRVGTIHACAAEKFVRQLKRRTIKRKTYYSGTYDVSGQFYQKEGRCDDKAISSCKDNKINRVYSTVVRTGTQRTAMKGT